MRRAAPVSPALRHAQLALGKDKKSPGFDKHDINNHTIDCEPWLKAERASYNS